MRRFQDAKNRFWDLEIHVGTVVLLRKMLGVNLLATNLVSIAKIAENPISLVAVLYVCCTDQATAAGLTEDQFQEGFTGDALLESADALIAAWIDYQPDPTSRDILRELAIGARAVKALTFCGAYESILKIDFPKIASKNYIRAITEG